MPVLDVFYTRVGAPTRVYAAAPAQLNFQARLLGSNGAIVADGNYSVEFNLYAAASGGTAAWTETQNLQVRAGYLSVYLGDVTPFSGIDWSQQQWLTMNVNGDGEMNPRLRLTSVPSAFRADQADALKNGSGTLTADGIAQLAPSNIQVVNSALAALRINQTGAGFLAQLQNNGSDVFTIAGDGSLTSTGNGTFNGGTLNLGSLTQAGSLVLHDGSGQFATLQTTSLAANRTYTFPDADGVVCLTTTCGGAANSFINGGNSFGGLATLGTNDTYGLAFKTDGQQRAVIDANGNFGIGTTGSLSTLFAVGGTTGNLTVATNGNLNTIGTVTAAGVTSNGALSVTSGGASITGNSTITGTLSGLTGLTVVSGGAAITGNSTITGTLSGLTGLTVASGGASITGGLNNNGGNITNAGSITGVGSNITATGALTVASTGANNLALNSGSNIISLGANELQTANSLTVDLINGSDTVFGLENSGAGVANLNLIDGGLQINGTTVITSGAVLQNVTASTNILTSGTLGVARGGTGLASVTQNGILFGDGTNALQVETGTNGQILMLNASGVPTFTTFTGDLSVSDAGAVTIANGAVTNTKLANSSITINTSGNIVGGSVSLGGNLTVSTVNNPTFSTSVTTPSVLSAGALNVSSGGTSALTLTSASGTILLGSDTVQRSGTSLNLDVNSGSNSTLTVTNSGSGVASLVVEGGISAGNGTFIVSTTGDVTGTMIQLDGSTTTSGGSGLTTSTNLAVGSGNTTLFDVGNYVRVTATNCGGTGISPCYAKITAKTASALTITPALRWTASSPVVEFHIPEIGGTNTADTLANRYGRGYFISGVATGNGTTYYNEDGISTSLSSFGIETSDAAGMIAIGSTLGASGTVSIGNASTSTTIYGNVIYTGNVTAPATGTAGYMQRSGTTISPSNAGDNFTTSGNISTSGSGTITAANGLTVSAGGASITGNSTISGTLTGLTGLTVSSGGFGVTGNSTIAGTLSGLTGLTVASGGFNVTGNSSVTGTLGVSSTLTVSAGGLAVTGNSTISGTLTGLTGLTIASGGFDVTGNSTISGTLTGLTGLTVTSGGANITGNSSITGTLTGLTGLTVASGGANITGNTTIAGTVTAYSTGYNVMGSSAALNAYGYFRSVDSGDAASRFELGAYDLSGTSQGARDLVFNPLGGNVAIGATTTAGLFSVGSSNQFQVSSTGVITAPTSTNSINGLIINSGALSGVTTINTSGGLTVGGNSIINGTLTGLTGLTIASGGFDVTGNSTLTGTLSGLTGLTVASGGASIAGNSTIAGTLSGLTGLTVVSGGFNVTGNSTLTGTLSGLTGLTVASGGASISGGAGLLVQQTGTGAAVIIDRTDGVIGSLKSGGVKVAFFFDDSGSFAISKDTRANISAGTGAGVDLLAISSAGAVTLAGSLSGVTTLSAGNLTVSGSSTFGNVTNNASFSSTGVLTFAGSGDYLVGADRYAFRNGGYGLFFNSIGHYDFKNAAGTTVFHISAVDGSISSNGINNNGGGITNAGAISGASTITASGNITTSGIYRQGALNGSTIGPCNANQFVANGVRVSGGIITAGSCRTDGLSDERLKENIVEIDDTILSKIKEVRTVTFNFKCDDPQYANSGMDCTTDDRQTGVIAQELAQIFPDLVFQDESGYFNVRYQGLSIYTLKAVGELANKVDSIDLSNIAGLSVTSGGATITGGVNNNFGGISEVGSLNGVTSINAETISLNAGANGTALTLTKDYNGVFTIFNNGALELKLDSANAFAIKDAANNSILNVDSASGKISLGGAGKTVLLTFGIKDTAGDPAGINGSEYYNSAMGKFRCYQNNRWQDCLPVTNASYVLGDRVESWTQPLTDTELPGEYRTWIDLTNAREFRLIMRVTSAGTEGATCRMQYANSDNGPWATLGNANAKLAVDQTGTLKADWSKIEDAANKEVLVRVVCGGDTNGSPTPTLNFSNISVQLR